MRDKTMKRIGIFGGTFNPIHKAHIGIAKEFAEQAALDLCIFVPAFISPFKSDNEHPINPARRIEMIETAIKNHPDIDTDKFELDTFEIDKRGISYTCQTIEHIKSGHNDSDLFLLIGSDNANDFTKWRNWEEILNNATLCVARRPDSAIDENVIKILESKGKVQILEAPPYDLSSSEIRERLAKGMDCTDLLEPAVLEYIKRNTLYQ